MLRAVGVFPKKTNQKKKKNLFLVTKQATQKKESSYIKKSEEFIHTTRKWVSPNIYGASLACFSTNTKQYFYYYYYFY